MVKNYSGKLLFWMILFLFLLSSAANAGDRFVIKPVLDVSYQVDSNFYKTDTTERTVGTVTVSPGLGVGYRTEKSKVIAKGVLNITAYDDHDDVPAGRTGSDENDYVGYDVSLAGDTMLFTRITAGLEGRWLKTRNPSERDPLGNYTDINEYTLDNIRPWIKYKITDRVSAGLELKNTRIDYTEDFEEDSSLFAGKANLYYELSRFTTIDLEYDRRDMEYDQYSSDYTSTQYGVNFSSKYKYFKFEGGIGYLDREFDQPGLKALDNFVWHLSVGGQNPPELGRDEKPRSYMRLSFDQNLNANGNRHYIGNNQYYLANRISLLLGHLFMEKLDARIEGYYQNSDYKDDPLNREDDTYLLSGSVAYFLNKWFTLTLKSGIESRDSSVSLYDYDNAFVLLDIIFNYDLGSR